MRPIRLSYAIVFAVGLLLTISGVHDTFGDESGTSLAGTEASPTEPTTPTPAPEGSSLQSDVGEVQERGVFRNTLEPKIFINPQATIPAPPTKIPVPGITAPKPGTVLPPDRYQAPTPNLTLIANALRLNHKSLTTLVTLPPNLPVTRPVDIGIIYSSPTGIGQMKQSYAGGTGNRFLYNDREGDGKPRAMEIAITLTEPSAGEAGIYRMKWHANLDPLYDVAMGRFEFTLLNFCDSAGQTEIMFVWALPDDKYYAKRLFSTALVPHMEPIPEFRWARSEVSWSQPLHQEIFTFVDNDPGWVHALSSFVKKLDVFWEGVTFSASASGSVPHLLSTPNGGEWVTGVRSAENDPCKVRFKYWRAKNLLLYPALQPR